MEILVFLLVFLIQLSSGKILSYLIFALLSLMILIKYGKIKYKTIFFFILFLLLILNLIEPMLIFNSLVRYELIWISLGIFGIFLSTHENMSNTRVYRILKSIFYSGLSGASFIFILSSLNIFIPSLNHEHYAGIRWVGGFDGPNEFSAFYVLILSIGLGLYISKHINVSMMIYSIIIIVPSVYFSYSRGSLFMFFTLIIVFIIVHIKNTKHRVLITSIYTGVLAFLFVLVKKNNLIENFMNVRSRASSRTPLLEASISMFLDKPIFGNGLGAFSLLSIVSNDSPHNDYLYILTAGGIIDLTILLCFYLYPFFISLFYRNYASIFFFITFYFSGFFFNNIVRGRISFLFWLIFGIMAALTLRRREHNGYSKTNIGKRD